MSKILASGNVSVREKVKHAADRYRGKEVFQTTNFDSLATLKKIVMGPLKGLNPGVFTARTSQGVVDLILNADRKEPKVDVFSPSYNPTIPAGLIDQERHQRKNSWEAFGFPTFTFSDKAAFLLHNTKLPDYDSASLVRLPFPTTALVIPIDGIKREFLVTQIPDRKTGDLGEITVLRVWNQFVTVWIPSSSLDWVAGSKGQYSDGRPFPPRREFYGEHRAVTSEITEDVETVINACAMICALPGEVYPVEKQPAKRKMESKAPSIPWSKIKHWIVGENIKINSESGFNERHGSGGWKIRSRFMVRGFWRRQACGRGFENSKIIWIRPFWKGPRTAEEALSRTYEVVGGKC